MGQAARRAWHAGRRGGRRIADGKVCRGGTGQGGEPPRWLGTGALWRGRAWPARQGLKQLADGGSAPHRDRRAARRPADSGRTHAETGLIS